MIEAQTNGIELEDLSAARSDFPSLKAVAGHRMEGRIQMLWVKLPDCRGWTEKSYFECIIDVRNERFTTYVLNVEDENCHPRLYRKATIPGTSQRVRIVCSGEWSRRMSHTCEGRGPRLSAYLNHVMNLLNA